MACILTIFKNEATAMDEWLQHHLSQGVSHVFMIDNASTDDFMPIIKKYEKYITLYTMPEQGVQTKHYNSVLPDIKKSGYKWCCVMDLDEFMVFEDPTCTVPGFCEKYFVGNIVELAIQWKIFGSNGHIQQPHSIRCGFTKCDPTPFSHKYICLIDKVVSLDIHTCVHTGERVFVTDALLYHYCIQSWEWFTNVKMTRGAADGPVNVRNQQYFIDYDGTATATDTLLKDRVLSGMYSFTDRDVSYAHYMPFEQLLSRYEKTASTASDINEHLPVLLAYTKQCSSVVECGVRSVVSSYAFALGLAGTPNNQYVMVDPKKSDQIDPFLKMCAANNVNASFCEQSDLDCPLVDTDLLFIDTWHVYGHLKRELSRWNASVKKFIILHDTTVDEWVGETIRNGWDANQQSIETGIHVDEIRKGLWPAVEEFLAAHPEWTIELRLRNNNGLTVLRRNHT